MGRALRRRYSRSRRRRIGHAGTFLGAEHRRENDERVEQNLPPELIGLWRKTKRQFRGTPHQRYEAFMQYVHDSGGERSGESMAALQDAADEAVERMIRARERQRPRESVVPDSVPF